MNWPIAAVRELLEPSLKHLGYSLVGVERTGPGGMTLRLTIDRAAGFVSVDDCERASVVAGPLLDRSGLLPDAYVLEVSSPGAERELRSRPDFERFAGRPALARFRSGKAEVILEGRIDQVADSGFVLADRRGGKTEIFWQDLIFARLVAKP